MCGIVGIINYGRSWQPRLDDFFKQLLLLDVVRGKDSTGAFNVNEKGEVDWRKAACPPWDFFGIQNVKPLFQTIGGYPFIVGHNRWATRGKVKNDNAHPFEHGAITLVHNGTLHTGGDLPKFNTFDVDSEALTYAINKNGIEKTWASVNGPTALAYYNSKEKTLNLIRNKDRPLFIMTIPKDDMVWFGSEIGLLKWVALQHGLVGTTWEMLPENVLHTYEMKSGIPVKKELVPYRYSYTAHFGGWGGLRDEYPDEWGDTAGDCAVVPAQTPTTTVEAPKVVQMHRTETVRHIHNQVPTIRDCPFKLEDVIEFSIEDYDDTTFQKGFTPISGSVLDEEGKSIPNFIVRGNFSGDRALLKETRNLLKGTITYIQGMKHNRTLINVRDVTVTEVPDPGWMTKEDKAKWLENKKKEKPVDKNKPVCNTCHEDKPNLIVVYRAGGPENICLDCHQKAPPFGGIDMRTLLANKHNLH